MTPPPLVFAPSEPRIGPIFSTIASWMAILGFVLLMFFKQATLAQKNAVAAKSANTPNLQMEIAGRFAVAQRELTPADNSPGAQGRHDQLREQMLKNLSSAAISPIDKLELIVVVRELQGTDAALKQLDSHQADFARSDTAFSDSALLQSIYRNGPQTITPANRLALIDHLGWFGKLALTQGGPADSPDRLALLRSARNSFLAMIAMLAGILGAFVLGIVLLILLIISFATGKSRFNFRSAPPVGEPVFLETFALWGIGSIALSYSIRSIPHTPLSSEFAFLIITTLVAMWPLVRGISWAQLRQSLGWHSGQGVLYEIGTGIIGYIAGLPIVGLGVVITLIASKVGHANPTHPIQQEFTGAMPLGKIIGLLFTLSVFAPFLEETMFRGAFVFHLRRRWRPWLSAAIVSLLFAAIHPQGWAGIPVLASIAIVLALLREWRGSLLASMTAHAINNGIVFLALVLVLH